MARPTKRRRGAIETARHQAKLDLRARQRLQAPILESCAPTWQDEVVLWATRNSNAEIQKIVSELARTDRCVMAQNKIAHENLDFLQTKNVKNC